MYNVHTHVCTLYYTYLLIFGWLAGAETIIVSKNAISYLIHKKNMGRWETKWKRELREDW